jgi:putative ABC transport system permease protein
MYSFERFALIASLIFREAVRALLRHKLRSALTTLGITVGTAAVVLVVAVGEAGSQRAQDEFAKLGDSLVWIEAGSRNVAGVRTGNHGTTSLTVEDADAIRSEVSLIKRLSPQVDGTVQIIGAAGNWYTRFRGEGADYPAIKRWTIAEGSSFSDEDVDQAARKIVLGETVRRQLFGDSDALGASVRMKGQPFEVIGVLGRKGQNGNGQDQDDWILLPYTTAEKTLRGGGYTWLDDILCSARTLADVNPAIDRVVSLMRQRHHIAPGDEDDFNIRRPGELLKAQVEAEKTLAALLLSVAVVSLLVGGIGIMNVMLASVAQRTREIGLRLAIGATERLIQFQFLGEAITLSVLGGLAGVVISFVAARLFESTWGGPLPIPPEGVLLALVSSTASGMFFGFYPAQRAARLDPIEALRHE